MHEWALAESVIKTIENNASIKKAKIVEVLFGELQDIDKEIFSFAFNELIKQHSLNIKIKIIEEKAEFKCNSCGKVFDLKSFKNSKDEKENIHFIPEMAKVFIRCPVCKSPDFEIIRGRGISIRASKRQ